VVEILGRLVEAAAGELLEMSDRKRCVLLVRRVKVWSRLLVVSARGEQEQRVVSAVH
jgi:hypothetical protein